MRSPYSRRVARSASRAASVCASSSRMWARTRWAFAAASRSRWPRSARPACRRRPAPGRCGPSCSRAAPARGRRTRARARSMSSTSRAQGVRQRRRRPAVVAGVAVRVATGRSSRGRAWPGRRPGAARARRGTPRRGRWRGRCGRSRSRPGPARGRARSARPGRAARPSRARARTSSIAAAVLPRRTAIEPSPSCARATVPLSSGGLRAPQGDEQLLLSLVEALEPDLDERRVDPLGRRRNVEGRHVGIQHPSSVSRSGDGSGGGARAGLGRRQRVLVGRRQVGGELERLEGRLGPADPLQELAVPAVRPREIAR